MDPEESPDLKGDDVRNLVAFARRTDLTHILPRLGGEKPRDDLRNYIVIVATQVLHDDPVAGKLTQECCRFILDLAEMVPYHIATTMADGRSSGNFVLYETWFSWRMAGPVDLLNSIAKSNAVLNISAAVFGNGANSVAMGFLPTRQEFEGFCNLVAPLGDAPCEIDGEPWNPMTLRRMIALGSNAYNKLIYSGNLVRSLLFTAGGIVPSLHWEAWDPRNPYPYRYRRRQDGQ